MAHKKFLSRVADYYLDLTRLDRADLADIIFICPNKRSAMFLKHYVQQGIDSPFALMPRFTTFGKFVDRRSTRRAASRNESLFTLYNAYRHVLERHGKSEQPKDFDRFIFWGDIILSDFDTIDAALASPIKLYENLRDLREITADFLSPRQKEVIRDIWGDTSLTQPVDTFWLHTRGNDRGDSKNVTRKFLALWEILPEIYDEFIAQLHSRGLTTRGRQLRDVAEALLDEPAEALRRHRFVFVGHSDLSTAEIAVMRRLLKAGAAEFLWDIPGDMSRGDSSSRAVSIIRGLVRNFPMPAGFSPESEPGDASIDITGIPSSVGQAKLAAATIRQWLDDGVIPRDGSGAPLPDALFDTAIVLPDQSLLMPLMLALPPEVRDINVTMSLPFSSTTFATLLRVIVSLQRRSRLRRDGRRTFFHEDVIEVLRHPYLQLIAPDEVDAVRRDIRRRRLYNLDADRLQACHPALAYIFTGVDPAGGYAAAAQYLRHMVDGLAGLLATRLPAAAAGEALELQILNHVGEQLDDLCATIDSHGIEMGEATFFSMFERLLDSMHMEMTGTPLRGMQVMGVLETRALDFDNIIFLSMNERTFPRRNYVNTMIPNNLRIGYGLPPIERAEGFHAYYFFRALSRARHVRLIYDSRPGHRGGGEMSRYLTQLIYLGGSHASLSHHSVSIDGDQPAKRVLCVDKSPAVMDELNQFKPGGRLRLSASALKTYMQCPLAFYLRYVKGLREEDTPEGFLGAGQLGNILHRSMCALYAPYEGRTVSAADITAMMAADIESVVHRETVREIFGSYDDPGPDAFNTEALLCRAIITRQIMLMLECERDKYCADGKSFTYIKGEKDIIQPWEVKPGLTVTLRMQIDRIDRYSDDSGVSRLRFIDYKSGSDDLSVGSDMNNLFTGDHKRMGIFQLLLYCEAYNDILRPDMEILPVIHSMHDIAARGRINDLTYDRAAMPPFPGLTAEFRPLLEQLISEIFDRSVPFAQCADASACTFCPFLSMCGKSLPKFNK